MLGFAILAVAILWVYWPAIGGGFLLDDDVLLTQNRLIAAPDGLSRFWFTTEASDYWPVTNSTLWLEWRLWRMNPTGYHATNLVFHLLDSWLIWLVLRRLSVPGAFLAALLFAVHPVNVESVVWIAQRKMCWRCFSCCFRCCGICERNRSDRRPGKGDRHIFPPQTPQK